MCPLKVYLERIPNSSLENWLTTVIFHSYCVCCCKCYGILCQGQEAGVTREDFLEEGMAGSKLPRISRIC
jgi:hypothetical protein